MFERRYVLGRPGAIFIKHLREKLKLREYFATEVHPENITNFTYYGRLQIQLRISLPKVFSNDRKKTLGELNFFSLFLVFHLR